MALRIGGGKAPMPPMEEALRPEEEMPMAEEAMPEDMMAELPESLEEEAPMDEMAGGEVDPMTAGYKGPESGPFSCSNCVFFGRHGEGTCAIVAGPIDPEGLCNMFTSASAGQAAPMDEDVPEPLPEEMPVEEAEASEEGY